jgi:choline dehydrogenase-like flavoprotein
MVNATDPPSGWPFLRDLLTESLEQLADASRQQPFDAVVVGGGTAGIVAALTLVARGQHVALLEAGPVALLTHVQSTDVRFQGGLPARLRGPLEYAPQHTPSGDPFGMLVGCLGGRGLFWNGACPRLQPHEFADWPLKLDELLPHYAWVEERFRVSTTYGDSALLQLLVCELRRAGFGFAACPFAVDTHPTGQGWLSGTIGNGMSLLLRGAALTGEQRNPRIAVRAFASRILLAKDGRQARGVLALDRDSASAPGNQVSYEVLARRVILAAGALESARLAQVSDIPVASGRVV